MIPLITTEIPQTVTLLNDTYTLEYLDEAYDLGCGFNTYYVQYACHTSKDKYMRIHFKKEDTTYFLMLFSHSLYKKGKHILTDYGLPARLDIKYERGEKSLELSIAHFNLGCLHSLTETSFMVSSKQSCIETIYVEDINYNGKLIENTKATLFLKSTSTFTKNIVGITNDHLFSMIHEVITCYYKKKGNENHD